ncbi:50S ribosomal protein L29 [Thioalkalivibrio thiocyanodenitrificans]|uniref:50S ribosomal protein L29 n=1 Tax=Thioalkalivibrio thiocyanodenitrificans TaxID=243063 RepID=UPI000363522C|nr:50S ribosomal protein L29 [Thioalkalivibrio thiocyanodenitrificans]
MKAQELREKNDEELHTELLELLREQFGLRMQRGAGQLARPDRFSKIRKDIARIRTIMNERAVAGE